MKTGAISLCSLLSILGLGGCAAEFDSQGELSGLRALAVHKSSPYARPGETVRLELLWHDAGNRMAAMDGGREIQIVWFAGCYNPPGDLFGACLGPGFLPPSAGGFEVPEPGLEPQPLAVGGVAGGFSTDGGSDRGPGASAPEIVVPSGSLRFGDPDFPFVIGFGESFAFEIPERIISVRPPPDAPRVPRYGLAYVFFALCAGEVRVEPDQEFPLGCFRGSERLGSRDFVAGYTAIYAYDAPEITNENPRVSGLTLGDEPLEVCIGAACSGEVAAASEEDGECPASNRIESCTEGDCGALELRPVVDQSRPAEKDRVLSAIRGTNIGEQMWINYYVDRGALDAEVKLLNDGIVGYNANFGTDYTPPLRGTSYLWAVVHDNRGGAQWARARLCVNR